jgi:surface protein
MSGMFAHASSFNGDVSKWNTAAVTYMIEMFMGASSFNGDVSNWNTAAVRDMSRMFQVMEALN